MAWTLAWLRCAPRRLATHRDASGRCDASQEPWALAIVVCTAGAIAGAVLFGTIGGLIGFRLGQQPTIIVQFERAH